MSALFATIAGVILVAAGPARAAGGIDSDPSYRDPISLSDQRGIDEEELPRSLSFKFASLYSRIADTAARLADFTHLDWTTMPSLGINIRFQSIGHTSDADLLDMESARRLFPGFAEGTRDRFSLRIDMSDDRAPLVDPSPRKPDDPIKDLIWLSLGARYDHSERLSLDIGYEHLWVNETTFDRPGGIGNDILGDYRSEMDLIGARLRWAFD